MSLNLDEVFDGLEDIRYTGKLADPDVLRKAVESSEHFDQLTELISYLCNEIAGLLAFEERVNPAKSMDDLENFFLELNGFLRECGCPHNALTEGPISQRLSFAQNRKNLLEYLIVELMTARMIACSYPQHLPQSSPSSRHQESEYALNLKMLLMTLGFPKPPPNITVTQLFSKLEPKLKGVISQAPSQALSRPLLKVRLTERQWNALLTINDQFNREYEIRRQMLLKRLDCTIQSFLWSDTAKTKQNEIAAVYRPLRDRMITRAEISIADILSAREDLLIVTKTTNESVRAETATPLNKVLMGKVPDRGGRANEQMPPPPEMPAFQKRHAPPERGRGGGHHRGGGVQGGWQGGGGRGGKGGYHEQHHGGGYHQQQVQYQQQQGYQYQQQQGHYQQQQGYQQQQPYHQQQQQYYNQGGQQYNYNQQQADYGGYQATGGFHGGDFQKQDFYNQQSYENRGGFRGRGRGRGSRRGRGY